MLAAAQALGRVGERSEWGGAWSGRRWWGEATPTDLEVFLEAVELEEGGEGTRRE